MKTLAVAQMAERSLLERGERSQVQSLSANLNGCRIHF